MDRSLPALAPLTLALALAGACTSPTAAESIDLPVEAAPREPALPSWEHQPAAEAPPVDPASQPRLSVARMYTRAEAESEDYDLFCNYKVEAHGFPAIDEDGETIVSYGTRMSSGGEGEDEVGRLSYYSIDERPGREIVFDRSDDIRYDWDSKQELDSCEQAEAEVRTRVDEINAKLADQRWRALEPLDVVDDGVPGDFDFRERRRPDIEALPIDKRPVEMLYNSGKFILRIRAAKVLVSLGRQSWSSNDEFCTNKPSLRELLVDRRSGLGLVTYDHISGACLCDDYTYEDLVELPQEVFAEVDARPTSALPPDEYAY